MHVRPIYSFTRNSQIIISNQIIIIIIITITSNYAASNLPFLFSISVFLNIYIYIIFLFPHNNIVRFAVNNRLQFHINACVIRLGATLWTGCEGETLRNHTVDDDEIVVLLLLVFWLPFFLLNSLQRLVYPFCRSQDTSVSGFHLNPSSIWTVGWEENAEHMRCGRGRKKTKGKGIEIDPA